MKKQLQLFWVAILFTFLISCKGHGQTDPRGSSLHQSGSKLSDVISAIDKVDTLFAINAPVRITRKIRMNQKGNLLMAAYTDVILYDGESFSKIPKPEGFESFDAFDAFEDSKGNIWIASTHFGVFRYNGEEFTHFTTEEGLAHNRTIDIHEDKAGNIWIATMGGASFYNGRVFQNYTSLEGMPHNDVSTIMEDGTGKIWFGTRGTSCIYDPDSGSFTEMTNNEGGPLTNVRSIIEDKKGNIWLSSGDGIFRFSSGALMRVSNSGGNHLYEDRRGKIWFTDQNVLSYFDKESLHFSQPKPTEVFTGKGMFFGLSEDEKGDIYVGTLNGIFDYNGNTITYYVDGKL